ncbi:MAG: tetratricopeptide repeat protein [Fidelibacterota bacterium]
MLIKRKSTWGVLVLALVAMPLGAVTRVAYTRPGQMMKIPTTRPTRAPYLFSAGFGSEIHNFSPFNVARGVYFTMDVSERFTLGFSSGQGADTTALENILESTYVPPVEFGFHFQQRVYVRNDISFSIGAHDIVFENADEGLSLDPKQLSFFGVIGSEKSFSDYDLSTFMGFGTGGFSQAFATGTTESGQEDTTARGTRAGVFAGFLLNTPFLPKWGGLDFVGEFDGSGINVGLRIPLTSDYRLSLGFTHIENLPAFSDEPYGSDHPGFTMGLDMSVPRGVAVKEVPGLPGPRVAGPAPIPEAGMLDTTLLTADLAVATLRDSIRVATFQTRNLATQVARLRQKSIALEDSVRAMRLEKAVTQKNINRAMRHLSRSLRYFYSGDYRESLQEVETALDLNPNLALAYARRGSIYYKLGDIQRATINWNLALQMDPEYDDVRNILKALHEDRLRTTSFNKE